MKEFTYFIITPGDEVGSFVSYPDGETGCYIKFGDQKSDHEDSEGIRKQYLTHNPDIGIAAVMDSTCFSNPYLGTRLKNYIIDELKEKPVGTTEWFSFENGAAWKLFKAMQSWDEKVLDDNDYAKLTTLIKKHLGAVERVSP